MSVNFRPDTNADALTGFLGQWLDDDNLPYALRTIFDDVYDKAVKEEIVSMDFTDAVSLVSYIHGFLQGSPYDDHKQLENIALDIERALIFGK